MDSVVEINQRDTTTRIRYIRASSTAQSTTETATTQTRIDSIDYKEKIITETPIAVQSKKMGVAWLRPRVRMVLCIIFFVIIVIFVVIIKKSLLLRR